MEVAVRVGAHVAIWTVILVPVILEISSGWRPIGDQSIIAIRSYQVLLLHSPLVGEFSSGSGLGHVIYDPGPLMFWLLTVPVHLDPAHGVLWGAAIWWGVVLSFSVEALWWTKGWIPSAVLVVAVMDMAWLLPFVFGSPMWNANFILPFLIATVALSWVVATVSLAWLPALVFTASVTAQSHLAGAMPAVALSLVALTIALVREHRLGGDRRLRHRGLFAGVAVCIVCWAAPLAQQIGGHPGNLAALARYSGGRLEGLRFGLTTIGAAGSPSPIWLHHYHMGFWQSGAILQVSPMVGGLVLGGMLLIAVAALKSGRTDLASLATIAATWGLSTVVVFAAIPDSHVFNIQYLIDDLWLIGILLWVVVGWAAVEAAVAMQRHIRRSGPQGIGAFFQLGATRSGSMSAMIRAVGPSRLQTAAGTVPTEAPHASEVTVMHEDGSGWMPDTSAGRGRTASPADPPRITGSGIRAWWAHPRLWVSVGVGSIILIATALGIGAVASQPPAPDAQPAQLTQLRNATAAIEHAVARGPVTFELAGASPSDTYGDTSGVAYRLLVDGWRPGLPRFFAGQGFPTSLADQALLYVPHNAHWPMVVVHFRGNEVESVTRIGNKD